MTWWCKKATDFAQTNLGGKKGGTVLINRCTPQEGKLLFAASIDLLGYK